MARDEMRDRFLASAAEEIGRAILALSKAGHALEQAGGPGHVAMAAWIQEASRIVARVADVLVHGGDR